MCCSALDGVAKPPTGLSALLNLIRRQWLTDCNFSIFTYIGVDVVLILVVGVQACYTLCVRVTVLQDYPEAKEKLNAEMEVEDEQEEEPVPDEELEQEPPNMFLSVLLSSFSLPA